MKRIKKLSLLLLMSAVSLYPAALTSVSAGGDAGDDSGEDCRGQKRGREEEGEAVGKPSSKKQKTERNFDGLPINTGSLCTALGTYDALMARHVIAQNPALLDISDVEYPRDFMPLHVAMFAGEWSLVQKLIDQGTAVNVVNGAGHTPLHMAVIMDWREAVDRLLIVGANVDAADQHGRTPLHYAIQFNQEPIVEILLEAGANINELTQQGDTSLSVAALHGHKQLVRFLIERGALISRDFYESLASDKQQIVKDAWQKVYEAKRVRILQIIQQAASRDVEMAAAVKGKVVQAYEQAYTTWRLAADSVDGSRLYRLMVAIERSLVAAEEIEADAHMQLPFMVLPLEALTRIVQHEEPSDVEDAWEEFLNKLHDDLDFESVD